MTAIPDWNLVDPRNTDAELVSGSVAGDKAAFAQIYDRYADRLYDFCVGMLRDRDGAADCVQDTFCLAATRLVQLREPDKLRPWLYSIARNEALRRLRQQRRETPTDELPDVQSEDAGPDTLAARTELAQMLADAAGGLSDRDKAVFDLAYRHDLNGSALADALGVTPATANTIVKRLRVTIERSLGALLVAQRAQGRAGNCPELDQMLASWDGQFTVLMRKRISRHIESCPKCDDERRRLVSPAALLGAAPVFMPAPEWLRDKTLGEIQLTSHGSAISRRTPHKRRWAVAVAMVLAVLGGSAALTLAWLNKDPVAIIPAEVSEPSPQPVVENPAPPSPLPPPPVVQQPLVQPRSQPPAVPNSPAPPSKSPVYEQPPAAEPPAPPAVEPPDAAPPSQQPPMSFSPTVIAPRPGPPTPGGNDDGGGARTGGSRVGGA